MLEHLKKWDIAMAGVLDPTVGVIIYQSITFTSKQILISAPVGCSTETDRTIRHWSEAIQIPAIINRSLMDYVQFTCFHEFLEESYPLIDSSLDRYTDNQFSRFYRWKGSDSDKKPTLLFGGS